MQIGITYQPGVQAPVAAAYIHGNDVDAWLRQIGNWNIPVSQLECYVLPTSLQQVQAAGLLVIFKDSPDVTQLNILEPYYCVEGKLYIPLHTTLMPQVSDAELKKLLIWEKQVIHPAIGFVGFEIKDRLDLTSLFVYDAALDEDWSFAHTGLPARPAFRQIQWVQESAEEMIESIKKDIGQKGLEEIPKKPGDEASALDKILDRLKFGLFTGIYSLAGLISKIIPELQSNPNAPQQTGLLQHLQNWLERNMQELERKRNTELNRLLKMFDDNDSEALRYAIPLDSPYLDRGKAASPGSTLTRKSTDFNLRNLGGGQLVDSWDTGHYYHNLRTKYMDAAQKETARKDYKKAAYIYAHLLGDYHSAADVLEQGKMYREAAALHKDHLNNKQKAAECLERGGLYTEAIDLYTQLGMDEKTGDLYKDLGQPGNAAFFYEQHINKKISNNDYLDAGRVIQEKLKNNKRASDTLLTGWQNAYQPEFCLEKYFDIVLAEDKQQADKKIRQVYEQLTPKHKRLPFLNVLERLNDNNKDEELKTSIQEIAYDAFNKEAEDKNWTALHSLKKFVPDDKLISSDTSRYVTGQVKKKPSHTGSPQVFFLDQQIKWLKAVWHGNQFLVIGIKDHGLHLARGNWYGNLEYYSWEYLGDPSTRFAFIASPLSSMIILNASDGAPVTGKTLPKNKYFNNSIIVDCPAWLNKEDMQNIFVGEEVICRLEINDRNMTLRYYNMDGKQLKSINCKLNIEHPKLSSITHHPYLVFRQEYCFSYRDNYIFSISKNGTAKATELQSQIRMMTSTGNYSVFFILVSTNAGCLLFKGESGELVQLNEYFAVDQTPFHITFIENYKFVLAEKKKAFVFEIVNQRTRITRVYETGENIIAVLLTSIRAHFAVIEDSGRVNIFES